MSQTFSRALRTAGSSSTQKITVFLKILDLEARQDYSNRAVVGGLDRFLEVSAGELAEVLGKAPVGPGGYALLTPADRRSWAEQIRDFASSLSSAQPAGTGRPAASTKRPQATPETPTAKQAPRAAPSRPTSGSAS